MFRIFHFTHSDVCAVGAHYGFNLYSLMINGTDRFFMCSLAISISLGFIFYEVMFPFAHFLYLLLSFFITDWSEFYMYSGYKSSVSLRLAFSKTNGFIEI